VVSYFLNYHRFFGIGKTVRLIQRLKGEPNLRLLCGFDKVPCKAALSTVFASLAQLKFAGTASDALVKKAHKDTVVCHVNRDSDATAARESVKKDPAEQVEKQAEKRG